MSAVNCVAASPYKLRAAVVLFLVCLPAIYGQTQTGRRTNAFRETPNSQAPRYLAQDRSVRRIRAVRLDQSLFDAYAAKDFSRRRQADPDARVRMTFFPDASFDVRWTDVRPTEDGRGVAWTGAVDGTELGTAALVVSGGMATGNLVTGDGIIYQIRTADDGSVWVREVDSRELPKEAPPLILPLRAEAPVERFAAQDAVMKDDGSVIDVMVLYTPKAREMAGGEQQIRQMIDLGITETNQGYANSGVNHRVHLVYAGEVQYQETADSSVDLTRLRTPDDGYLDEVHALRDTYQADLVSLWANMDDACGIGYLITNPTVSNPALGFNVVSPKCATGYYSFGHEMGHNLGASHARDDGTGPGAFPYSYGYKQTMGTHKFRTIMAYDNNCSCTRVNYWSNPNATVDGDPAGIDPNAAGAAANYLTLNNTAKIVANYRTRGDGGTAVVESAHPYADNTDKTWTYTLPGNPASLNVAFDAMTSTEPGYDFIHIYDGNDKPIAGSPFTGTSLAGATVVVPGATVKVRLVSDGHLGYWGFRVVGVTANGGPATSLPKLTVTSFTGPTTAAIGGTLKGVKAIVANEGNAASGPFRIGIYFSQQTTVTTADIGAPERCATNGVDPGGTKTCSGDLPVPAGLTPGKWYMAVIADDQNQVQQSDRSGNIKLSEAGAITITGNVPAELVSPAPGSLLSSGTVKFEWTTGVGVQGYWLSIGTQKDGHDLYNHDQGTSLSATVSGLPTNGSTIYVRLQSRMSATDIQERSYVLRAANVPEGGDLPKLVVTAFKAPTSGVVGVNLKDTSVSVLNQGKGAAAPFRVAFYYSRQKDVTTADIYSRYTCAFAEGLAAGASSTCNGEIGVPGAVSEGVWYLAAIADDQGKLKQSDTSGSIRASDNGPLTITGKAAAEMVAPLPDSTLSSARATFRWNGSNADEYKLDIGTAAGKSDIYSRSQEKNLSADVDGLPVDGKMLYVRLSSRFGTDWLYKDYSYRAFNAGGAGAAPKLVVASFTAPTSAIAGVPLSGTRVTVANQGNAAAGPFRIGYYYSQDATVTTSDADSGWFCDIKALAPGASVSCSGSIGVPADLEAGSWYLGAIADDQGALHQQDTTGSVRTNDNGKIAVQAGIDFVLRVDPGSFEYAQGYPTGRQGVYFVNRLTPTAYPATLKQVQIYFGNRLNGLPAGTNITVVAAPHPDGAPAISGPEFQKVEAKITDVGTFNTFQVPPMTIYSGDFIVGFSVDNPADVYPADKDKATASQQRSYVSEDGAEFILIDDINLPGNFGIRATVSVTAAPSMSVSPSLDFGMTSLGNSRKLPIAISNAGASDLLIDAIDSTDQRQFAVLSGPERIAPGSTADAYVEFRPASGGTKTATLTIVSNDPFNPTAQISLRGSGNANLPLAVDSGRFTNSVGWGNGTATAHFVNRLTPPAYPATLRSVLVYFGDRADGLAPGATITVLSAANPSGSATIDDIKFARKTAKLDSLGAFIQFIVDPVTIESGDFVVGFMVEDPPGVYPADTDETSTPQGRSYYSSTGTTFRLMEGSLAGNLGIRAAVTLGPLQDEGIIENVPRMAGSVERVVEPDRSIRTRLTTDEGAAPAEKRTTRGGRTPGRGRR